MIAALLRRSFGRTRSLLIPLALVLMALQVLIVAAAAYVQEEQGFSSLLALLPPFAQQVMGGVFSSFGAMVSFGYFHPIVIIVFVGVAITVASEPAADVESGVVDLVVARPVRRVHLVTRSALMLVLVTTAIAGLMVTSSWCALRWLAPKGVVLPLAVLLRLASNLVAVAWAMGSAALAAATIGRRRTQTAGTVAIAGFALYLLNFLADLWPRLRPYGPLSPFHYYQPLGIVTGIGTRWAGDLLLLTAVGAAFCAVAYVCFSRRDL